MIISVIALLDELAYVNSTTFAIYYFMNEIVT